MNASSQTAGNCEVVLRYSIAQKACSMTAGINSIFITHRATTLRILFSVLFLVVTVVSGCTGLPKGIEPIRQFDLQQYYGKWYEVARLNHRFERNLQQVTAEYSPGEDGFVVVKNRGYNTVKEEWKEAIGKAKLKSDPQTGHLLVSFFGPVYASYVIFELDNYQQAYVVGSNRKNLWFLSRTPEVSDAAKNAFLTTVQDNGFEIDELIWVDHSQ